jgi:hypothetical protein
MPRNQGLIRLKQGVIRDLQQSELSRGYIYITMDRAILDILNDKVTITYNGLNCGMRKIDKYGRIFPRGELAQKLKNSKNIELKFDESKGILGINLL